MSLGVVACLCRGSIGLTTFIIWITQKIFLHIKYINKWKKWKEKDRKKKYHKSLLQFKGIFQLPCYVHSHGGQNVLLGGTASCVPSPPLLLPLLPIQTLRNGWIFLTVFQHLKLVFVFKVWIVLIAKVHCFELSFRKILKKIANWVK